MKRGTLDHPKVKRLARMLDVPRLHAAGMLEALFHYTARYAPQGDVGRHDIEDLADALDWDHAGDLVAALRASGWIDELDDGVLYVHEWHVHADDATRKSLERRGEVFANGEALRGVSSMARQQRDSGAPTSRQRRDSPSPEPSPSPSSEEKSVAAPAASPRGAALAGHLAACIRAHNQRAKVPKNLVPWALEIDRMLRIDEVPPDELEAVITWATSHDFWAPNILSASKLRKQYATLYAQRRRENDAKNRPGGGFGGRSQTPLADAAARMAERRAVRSIR